MSILGTAIGVGASLLGGKLARSSEKSAAGKTQAWNEASYNLTKNQFRDLQQKSIQHRVADAKAAGVHPLFALGASASGASPAPFIPGQFESGSAVGEGISAAGRAVGSEISRQTPDYPGQKAVRKRAEIGALERQDAETALTRAQEMQVLSETARATQEANHRRTPEGQIPPDHWKDIVEPGKLTLPGGAPWHTSPSTRGERWEGEYQEWGNLPAFYRLIRDTGTNIGVSDWLKSLVTAPGEGYRRYKEAYDKRRKR